MCKTNKLLPDSSGGNCTMRPGHTLVYLGRIRLSKAEFLASKNKPILFKQDELVKLTNTLSLSPELILDDLVMFKDKKLRLSGSLKLTVDSTIIRQYPKLKEYLDDDSSLRVGVLNFINTLLDCQAENNSKPLKLQLAILKYGKNRISLSDIRLYVTY